MKKKERLEKMSALRFLRKKVLGIRERKLTTHYLVCDFILNPTKQGAEIVYMPTREQIAVITKKRFTVSKSIDEKIKRDKTLFLDFLEELKTEYNERSSKKS